MRYDQGHRANRGVAASVHCATRRQNAAARLEQSKRIMHIMRNNAPKTTRQMQKMTTIRWNTVCVSLWVRRIEHKYLEICIALWKAVAIT